MYASTEPSLPPGLLRVESGLSSALEHLQETHREFQETQSELEAHGIAKQCSSIHPLSRPLYRFISEL